MAQRQRRFLGRAKTRCMHGLPASAPLFVSRMVDLPHARIQTAYCALGTCSLRHRQKRAHSHYGKVRTEREPLSHATGDSETRERAGSCAERDTVEIAGAYAVPLQQLVHHVEQQLGVALAGESFSRIDVAFSPQRDRAVFSRSFEREYLHSSRWLHEQLAF